MCACPRVIVCLLLVCFHQHNDPEKYSRIRRTREYFWKFAQTRLIIRAPTRARLSRSIYFLLVITTEDDLCHGPQFDVIWAIVINLMSYMRSTHQNGSWPFRNNGISQELRELPYYPSKVDYVCRWINLFAVEKCGRPPIIESNILTENTCFGYKNHKESHYPKDKMSSNYAFFVVASSPWWPQLWLKMIDWHESVPIFVFPCRVIYRWVVGNPLSFDVYKNWFQGDIHFSK